MPVYIVETTYGAEKTVTSPVVAKAAILLCQDAENRHVVMYGKRSDLEDLLAWGAVNRTVCTPIAEEESVVRAVLRPKIGDSQEVLWIRPESVAFTATEQQPPAWTVDYMVKAEGEQHRFAMMTDALLFVLEKDGTRKNSIIGSGFQRQSLLETGIGALFGEETLDEYALALHGPPSSLGRRAYEQILRVTRDKPRSGGRSPSVLVIDILQLSDEEDTDDDKDK